MAAAFRDAFAQKDFVVTAEIGPPKGTDVSTLGHHIELLKDKVDGLNVTDNQSSVMRISSLAVCRLILDHGGEPVLHAKFHAPMIFDVKAARWELTVMPPPRVGAAVASTSADVLLLLGVFVALYFHRVQQQRQQRAAAAASA